jgi:hypothetical protein
VDAAGFSRMLLSYHRERLKAAMQSRLTSFLNGRGITDFELAGGDVSVYQRSTALARNLFRDQSRHHGA